MLLLALLLAGAAAPLEIVAEDFELAWHARLPVELRNSAQAPRQVRLVAEEGALRVVPAEGLTVPAAGSLRLELLVFRGRADWGSQHRLRLLALGSGPEGRPLGLAEVQARVASNPAWLPRLRWPLLALGLALLAGALGRELLELRRT